MQTSDPAAAGPDPGPLSNPLEVFGSDALDAKTTALDVRAMRAPDPVVCDGSVYDASKPHLLVTLENHTVEGFDDNEHSFDATCNRIISTVSTHDRCGVLVASKRHAKALQSLGYPVVGWGQTVAFPMVSAVIAGMGTGEPHSGALTVHSFFEPKSLHNVWDEATGGLIGDGSFDGLNHLAGSYIPLALALRCSMTGDTHVNLETTNSAMMKQKHEIKIVVGSDAASVVCRDGTGGAILPDNEVVYAANAREGAPALVVTNKQVTPGFTELAQEMSGCTDSFSANFLEGVKSTIGEGAFQKFDTDLELEIRRFASSKVTLAAPLDAAGQAGGAPAEPAEGLHINLCDLSPKLQLEYSSSSMVCMLQPLPIAGPTVLSNAADDPDGAAADAAEAAKYGSAFSTNSYTLESHFALETGRDIHPFAGIMSLTHALFLGQISTAEAESICMPYARLDSNFRCCAKADCNCAALQADAHQPAAAAAAAAAPGTGGGHLEVSSRFERMLSGVSNKIALTSGGTRKRGGTSTSTATRTGKDAAADRSLHRAAPAAAARTSAAACTALTYAGTCECVECHNATRLINLARRVTSSTHAYQKSDNYTSDQTVHAFDAKGIPQYTGTESMLRYGTALKAPMMRMGPGGPDDIQMRIGMNTDDCENCAFQGKAIMETLLVGSRCVSRDYFHPPPAAATTAATGDDAAAALRRSAQNVVDDKEAVRLMRLDSHSKLDQRRQLLVAEVLGEKVKVNLGFFITGSASESNDTKGHVLPGPASSAASTCSGAPPIHSASAITARNAAAPRTAVGSAVVVELPATAGCGMQAMGSKPRGRRLVHQAGASALPSTGEEAAETDAPTYGGHCTNTLSVVRNDDHLQVHIVEGTGYVFMNTDNVPCKVRHRGEVGAGDVADKDIGFCGGPINTDHAVDVTMKGLMSSHVATTNAGLTVPGANMRPPMGMGDAPDIAKNMTVFYKELISMGGMQCVQAHGHNSVKPGVDVKTFVNQKVHRVISRKTASQGHAAVHKALDGATCGLIQVANPDDADHRQFSANCKAMSRAVSPLRLSVQVQDKASLGRLDSLVVNFPDDAQLKAKFGHGRTFFVTHVVRNEEPANYAKVLASISAKARQKNSVFVNMRFAEPVVMASKEIVQFWRLYGAPYEATAV